MCAPTQSPYEEPILSQPDPQAPRIRGGSRTLRGVRVRRRTLGIALAAGLALGALGSVPAAADAGDDLDAAKAAVDELAERWFDAQARSVELDHRIERLELELTQLQRSTRRLRGDARAQAVALYEGSSSGVDTGSIFESESAMDADRRNELLAAVNEIARRDIDAHAVAAADVRTALRELEAARDELDATLDQLRDDEVALQAQLAQAQQAYRRQVEAERAEAARAAEPDDSPGDSDPGSTVDDPDPTDSTDPDPDPDSGGKPGPVDPPPPPEPGEHPHHNDPFLSCVRQRESRGDYTVVNWDGPWYGAYQFAASTWDATASHAGRPELIGVQPNEASPWDQDDLAWVLYQWQGMGPWGGGCG